MDHFCYQAGELRCEGVAASRIAEAVGTPAYIYSAATLSDHFDAVVLAFHPLSPLICYSIKSCANTHICRFLRQRGAGFDVVSGGELARAIEAGGDPARVVFAGVGKTDAEISQAIDAGVGLFNIESEAELQNLITIAARRGRVVDAALRVNPDVDPRTHTYTSTGLKETKFGVDLVRARAVFQQYAGQEAVRLRGIHLHIGSPVNSVDPYVEAIRKGLSLIDDLRRDGFMIDTLDIGGGFGAHYRAAEAPPAVEYAKAIVPLLAGRGLRIIMEPGRSIAANAGILLTRVLYVKKSGGRSFLIVDAGMNDLIRPALYDAYHFIWPVLPPPGLEPVGRVLPADDLVEGLRRPEHARPGLTPVDVVGPVCESGDFLAKDRLLPPVVRGDLLAVFTAGAYGMAMASNYNSRPRPPEVLVEGNVFRLIRRRETYDDLLAPERL
jgi:diaminopimelate decarboxylase